jgi:hypothetical protein
MPMTFLIETEKSPEIHIEMPKVPTSQSNSEQKIVKHVSEYLISEPGLLHLT